MAAWLVASVAVASASARMIPEGAALWFACTEPSFAGPPQLACPQPYTPQYLSTFLAGFQRFTPENEFQMQYLEPYQNHFNFTVADQIARFAVEHHLTIRGHSLLWWAEEPAWLSNPLLRWTAPALRAVMDDYIRTVVGHFARAFPGLVSEWDVVNEPLTQTGTLITSIWEQVLGPGYIAAALTDAHEADPAANLVINSEGSGAPGPETTALLNLATGLKRENVPLDTVGFEAHVTTADAPSLRQLLSLWRQYALIGVNVEVTELDVNNLPGGLDDPAAKQAVFERYATACQLAPNCTGYTVWGVADSYSWLGPETDALLYDPGFRPTPAAAVVAATLAGQPAPGGRATGAPRLAGCRRRDRARARRRRSCRGGHGRAGSPSRAQKRTGAQRRPPSSVSQTRPGE
ncbi:endo-1,4-beta-xylanase [Conexibacter sp. DBS9H8]|uniref:endo-1,4-beta-xylanase n=1 Tax=Conexibacter sp. DBS9H8 TaxID=2937801 RepID=UPI00200F96A2|nr:endo-1,4-beta-xylanase [Conexibacter sp. DBS9H8]